MARERWSLLRVTLLTVALLAVTAGCGVADGMDRLQETIDESLEDSSSSGSDVTDASDDAEPQWVEYANETGLFTVELPAEPEYLAIEQNDVTINFWSAVSQDDSYGIGEYVLEPGVTYDFETGVIGAVDEVVNSIEEQLDRPAGSTMVDEFPEIRGGHVGVRFVADVTVDDEPYGTVNGAVYDTGDLLVLLTMIDLDGDDGDGARRFIDSLDFTP